MKPSNEPIQTEFTHAQILGYMVQGAIYAGVVIGVMVGFVLFFWVVGRILPPEEYYFSALEMGLKALA